MRRQLLLLIAFPILGAALLPRTAEAACSSPAGTVGEIFYNGDYEVMQFCDGTNWIGMGGASSGSGVTDGDKGDISVSGTGSSWLLNDDVLDFTELKDALSLDASTDIAISGSQVLSLTNTGTGNSFIVNDQATDASPFVIDAAGNVGIGVPAPTQALDVAGKTISDSFIARAVTGVPAPTGGSGNASSFDLVDVTGATASATVTSNAVTLTGFTGLKTASCTGCTAIARNGAWGSTTVTGFAAGDTIAVRLTANASAGIATNATVSVGGTYEVWSVTTASAVGPNPFSFADQTDVTPGLTATSNAVTLSGFSGTLTASCNNCTGIARNGVWGFSPMPGFVSGNTIAIRQNASTSAGTSATTAVTVGSTVSGTWTVANTAACSVGITVGQACPDGTIYAGTTPDGNMPMYTTPCDYGMSWSGSACTGTRSTKTWNNGVTSTITTGYTSGITGLANTAGLSALVNIESPYAAVTYCDGLVANGKSDWYLPATDELNIIYLNRLAISNFDVSGAFYWSSTENSGNTARAMSVRFSDGTPMNTSTKGGTAFVRCVRR